MTLDILIRAAKIDDVEDILEIHAQPKAQGFTLQLPYISLAKARQRLESQTGDRHLLVAEVAATGQVVGMLGLSQATNPRRAHTGQIGMAVHDDYHGQGVGSKLMAAVIDLAENWLNLSRLELTVFTDNAPAIALYKKFDFEREGTLRRYAFRNGQFVDADMMARLTEPR